MMSAWQFEQNLLNYAEHNLTSNQTPSTISSSILLSFTQKCHNIKLGHNFCISLTLMYCLELIYLKWKH